MLAEDVFLWINHTYTPVDISTGFSFPFNGLKGLVKYPPVAMVSTKRHLAAFAVYHSLCSIKFAGIDIPSFLTEDIWIGQFLLVGMHDIQAVVCQEDTIAVFRRFGSQDDFRQLMERHVYSDDAYTLVVLVCDRQAEGYQWLAFGVGTFQWIRPPRPSCLHGFGIPYLLRIGAVGKCL